MKNMKKHMSQRKKLVCKENFALVEVMKAFMKTKENGQNIYKFMNAWLRNC